MTEAQRMIATFLADIRNGCLSDALIFADWLEEHGDTRGALIREAVQLSEGKARRRIMRLFPNWRKGEIMGCDIHCYIEYRVKKPRSDWEKQWRGMGGRINPGRNYGLFARLAGVRGGPALIKPRGKVKNGSYQVNDDLWCFISEKEDDGDDWVTPEKAATWHKHGSAYRMRNDKPTWVENPDWHTHSWHIANEWEAAIKPVSPNQEPEYYGILAALRALESAGFMARVVFWFDN